MEKVKKYIGDKAFYRYVLVVTVPIMVQNGITNFVSLLDNIMVGRLGTEAMSGVSIVNQFIFIFNLLIFGAVSAAGIFTAQYHGLGDVEGVRNTFRFKWLINLLAGVAGVAVFWALGEPLISLFLHDGTEGDLALTLAYGQEYLSVMLVGLIPYALSQVYASTMRETGETVLPMVASIAAVATNFVLNSLLIFGLLGFPALGVTGAAIATVVSRFVELLILAIWGMRHATTRCPYLHGAFASFRIPRALSLRIAAKGLPLMLNEFFWSIAVTMRNQCYSVRGLDVVAAQNIASTIFNVFSVVYLSLGSAIAIIIGNQLGAGRLEEARDTNRKMMVFAVLCSSAMSLLLVGCSFLFPLIYNTTDAVRGLATYMIIVSACIMPFSAFANAAYYTLRSGGQVLVTLLFDSVYMWAIVMPATALCTYLTGMDIHLLYAVGQGVEIFKCLFGYFFLRQGSWVRQLVSDPAQG